MALTTQDRILIETRVSNDGPSVGVAYILWFCLGAFSAHRFYLGRTGTAILQILCNLVLIGFIWVLIDVFLIPGLVRARQDQIRDCLTQQALTIGTV
ncbi:TM2 domain-containing membrane protein YozV [Methylobacterium sp. BE186]|uniref:TM2 domain-containing protein n=1 Tax=Methylobacterium sp. BE186 TaxID=2817715 RepID=UPI00285970D1|nr:TM2 domain-containing protein [Methylobacterium sp. BE186]MDR7036587.1 TM2 domain-containing membrane protein YozV [Methylobacterium sp. BE186]